MPGDRRGKPRVNEDLVRRLESELEGERSLHEAGGDAPFAASGKTWVRAVPEAEGAEPYLASGKTHTATLLPGD